MPVPLVPLGIIAVGAAGGAVVAWLGSRPQSKVLQVIGPRRGGKTALATRLTGGQLDDAYVPSLDDETGEYVEAGKPELTVKLDVIQGQPRAVRASLRERRRRDGLAFVVDVRDLLDPDGARAHDVMTYAEIASEALDRRCPVLMVVTHVDLDPEWDTTSEADYVVKLRQRPTVDEVDRKMRLARVIAVDLASPTAEGALKEHLRKLFKVAATPPPSVDKESKA